jgi:uncharacterized protein YtpQ (UPF0354 family)
MQEIPWWVWPIGGVVLIYLFLRSARRSFRRTVCEEAIAYLGREHPDVEVIDKNEKFLTVSSEDFDEGQLYLQNLYYAIAESKKHAPEDREELYDRFIGGPVRESKLMMQPLSLDTHGDRIMPRILPSDALDELQKGGDTPHTPLNVAKLHVVYVLDYEHSVAYLTDEQRRELGLDLESLHQRALDNLAKTFAPQGVRAVIDERSLVTVKSGDSYDAARLLLVGRHLGEGEAVLAAIADRDSLVLIPVPDDESALSKLAKLAKTPGSARPICDQLLKVTKDEITLA